MRRDGTEDVQDSDEKSTIDEDPRALYERPQLLKKRSVSRVTLFAGSGASGTGVTNM